MTVTSRGRHTGLSCISQSRSAHHAYRSLLETIPEDRGCHDDRRASKAEGGWTERWLGKPAAYNPCSEPANIRTALKLQRAGVSQRVWGPWKPFPNLWPWAPNLPERVSSLPIPQGEKPKV